ncbi:hypothetical protein BH11PLA1_BH11PLA1_19440 [soil metagenome]
MRLITSKLWRAFPELDQFDDERCAAFVRVARQRVGTRLASGLFLVLMGLVGLVGAIAGLMFMETGTWTRAFGYRSLWAQPVAPVAAFVIPLLSIGLGFFVRDRLIRRVVRRVLVAHGKCARCGFSLLGIPVDAEMQIVCPECGMQVRVDPAVARLATDADGRTRLEAAPDGRSLWARVFTRRRVMWGVKALAALALLLVVAGAAFWGWREYMLVRQAKVAKADRVPFAKVEALRAAANPPESAGANAWDFFDDLNGARLEAEAAGTSGAGVPLYEDGTTPYPEFAYVGHVMKAEEQDGSDGNRVARRRAEKAMAERVVAAFLRGRGMEAAAKVASAPRAVGRAKPPVGEPLILLALPDLGAVRANARLLRGVMEHAFEVGDKELYLAALRGELALTRMGMREPILISNLVGIAVRALAETAVVDHLVRGMPTGWAADVSKVYLEMEELPDLSRAVEGERLFALDTLAWIYAEPGDINRRRGSIAGNYATAHFQIVPAYAPLRARLGSIYDQYALEFKKPAFARTFVDYSKVVLDDELADFIFTPDRFNRSCVQIEVDSVGTRTLLAIQRYRDEHADALPPTLAALCPAYLAATPIDPATGSALGYRIIEPARDALGRRYLLYSIGADGVDDGGREPPPTRRWEVVRKPGLPGFDFVFNRLDE